MAILGELIYTNQNTIFMIKQLLRVKQKVFFVLILAFFLLGNAKGYSQVNSGLAISWDKEVMMTKEKFILKI